MDSTLYKFYKWIRPPDSTLKKSNLAFDLSTSIWHQCCQIRQAQVNNLWKIKIYNSDYFKEIITKEESLIIPGVLIGNHLHELCHIKMIVSFKTSYIVSQNWDPPNCVTSFMGVPCVCLLTLRLISPNASGWVSQQFLVFLPFYRRLCPQSQSRFCKICPKDKF